MTKVIVLNGPPGVGKDTIAASLGRMGTRVHTFKEALLDECANLIRNDKVEEFYDRADDRDLKEVFWPVINASPRHFLIHVSEVLIKPQYGSDYFGRVKAEDVIDDVCAGYEVVFSDGGFSDEVSALAERGLDVNVVRLHRMGFDFDGDSRDYIKDNKAWRTHDIILEDDKVHQAVLDIVREVYGFSL